MQILNDNLYAWVESFDTNTILQAETLSRLPILAGPVALMPDAHLGIGATVGSVIATEGAVVPAAVGVDLGCLDMDTEFCTPNGWKKFSEYQDGDLVLQYDIDQNISTFVEPQAYIKRPEEWFYHLYHSKGLNQMVSSDHRVLYYPGYRKKIEESINPPQYKVQSAEDFVEYHNNLKKGVAGAIKTTFRLSTESNIVEEIEKIPYYKAMIMTAADGSIRTRSDGSTYVEVHLKKARKIEHAAVVLAAADIEYSFYEQADGTVVYKYDWSSGKDLSFFYKIPSLVIDCLLSDIFAWDGTSFITTNGLKRFTFSSNSKDNADAVQFALAATGIRAGIYKTEYPNEPNWNPTYQVYTTRNRYVGFNSPKVNPVEKVPSKDGFSYCFTVPSGFLVLRRGDSIFVTGNCGMMAVHTNLSAEDLPDDLEKFLPVVGKSIPAGVGQGHEEGTRGAHYWLDRRGMPDKLDTKQRKTAMIQLGTLGSGNHFFEVCLDENDSVWLVLHSGSRGIGNQLAQQHIKTAKTDFRKWVSGDYKLEDQDLAWFVEGTPEFDDYITDMLWAQDYAFANRQLMMDAVLNHFFEYVGHGKVHGTINCHHNFCQKEVHNDKEVWVTRKGAIQASTNDWGVIPGSMGAETFIVKGKGNSDSWNSCSHGAGRTMSRSKAKKTYTAEDLTVLMGDIVWDRRNAHALIDEIPEAYKDINKVMAAQSDLVEVQHTLHQILNYKGL